MITTVARDFRTVDVSVYGENTVLNILSNEELEKERRNAAYIAEMNRRREEVMRGNYIHMTSAELRALVND